MTAEQLYIAVSKILKNGNNAEVRKKPDGTWQIMEVKKNIVV